MYQEVTGKLIQSKWPLYAGKPSNDSRATASAYKSGVEARMRGLEEKISRSPLEDDIQWKSHAGMCAKGIQVTQPRESCTSSMTQVTHTARIVTKGSNAKSMPCWTSSDPPRSTHTHLVWLRRGLQLLHLLSLPCPVCRAV